VNSGSVKRGSAPDPNGLPSGSGEFAVQRLSGQQQALFCALDKRDCRLSMMYRGGIHVLNDPSNPDRFAQCAHSMRELMEKLPQWLDVPTSAKKANLKEKVREVEDAFCKVKKRTKTFSHPKDWCGAIDTPLQKFLVKLSVFFDWFQSDHPKRRDEVHRALTRLDNSGQELPKPLADLNVHAWGKKKDYFIAISHHIGLANEHEFLKWIDALERFLLDRLEPRTFDDLSEIDTLLEEGKNDA